MPRNLLNPLTFVFLLSIFFHEKNSACGFDFVGDCATSIRFSANTTSKEYLVTQCPYGNMYGSSLGTGLTNLQLTSASTMSWESCTNVLVESAVFYRVYKDPLSKGGFQKVLLSQKSLRENPPYRTKTFSGDLSIDLLAGLLPNTTYTCEIYYQLGVDADRNGTIDQTKLKDNNGLYYAATFQTGNIIVNVGFPVNVVTQNVPCNGSANGSATVSVSGGKAPYSYKWSNGASGATVTNLKAGSYSVTATDSTQAIGIKSFNITEPAALSVSLSTTNPSCLQTNGSIKASISGGNTPFTYLWSNKATTSSLSNLANGVYGLTVTDSKGCTTSSSSTLSENCGGNGAYCTSVSDAPWNEWIALVQFNTLDNASEKVRTDRFAIGYSDWKDKTASLSLGGTYSLTIKPGLSWPGLISNLYFRAWIDLNGNGAFEDAEKVFEKNAISQTVSGPVLVPASTKLGTTTMRISMKKGAYSTACEAFAAGEVEDYTVIINSNGVVNPCTTDTIAPEFSNCPQNIILATTDSTAIATWVIPSISDNCSPATYFETPGVVSTNYKPDTAFPLGTTKVSYGTADATGNKAAHCNFNVIVERTVIDNSCKKYTVENTNDICGQTWKPFGMILKLNNQTHYYHSDQLIFENSGTTAILRGTFRSPQWLPVQVTINLLGGTSTAPTGSPRQTNCSGTGSDYKYFTSMSGTVGIDGKNLTISSRGSAFQVGVGANLQNQTDLGASGQFILSDSTLGEFGFKLTNATTCNSVEPLVLNQKPVFELEVRNEMDKAHLMWVNNTGFKNDYFEVQKSDENSIFRTLDFINEPHFDTQLHTYLFTDIQMDDGENIYRIKAVHKSGDIAYSDVKTIKYLHFADAGVFPNPASDKIYISLKKQGNKNIKILIYNQLGISVKQLSYFQTSDLPIEMSVEGLQKGMYFVRITTAGQKDIVKKIFVSE